MAEDSSDGCSGSEEAADSHDIDAEARSSHEVSASGGVAHDPEQANSVPRLEDSKVVSRDESLAPGEAQETSPAARDDLSASESGETSDGALMDESPTAASPSSPAEAPGVELPEGTAGIGAPLAMVDQSSSHADSAKQVDLPEQISDVTAPRRSEQELEQGVIREVHVVCPCHGSCHANC